jgi:hypothetical protein
MADNDDKDEWKLVPTNITKEMLEACEPMFGNELCFESDQDSLQRIWNRLLSAIKDKRT